MEPGIDEEFEMLVLDLPVDVLTRVILEKGQTGDMDASGIDFVSGLGTHGGDCCRRGRSDAVTLCPRF